MGIAPVSRKGIGAILSAEFAGGLDVARGIVKKTGMGADPAESASVSSLYRYPVKGLSGERLASVALAPGATFPMDRAYALENGPSGFDPEAPTWQPKIKFLCLMRNASIAALTTRYDDASGMLSVSQGGSLLLEARLTDDVGRAAVETFFQKFMGSGARGSIRVLQSPGHSFSDVAKKVVSIINLESVAAVGKTIDRDVHPLRFRGNLHVAGWPAWFETQLVGRELEIGTTRLRVVKMIQRCAATEVNPETAERDIAVPEELYRLTGEDDCGIYAEVTTAGTIAEGDRIRILG
jgi:uncharacterized protein YcbX